MPKVDIPTIDSKPPSHNSMDQKDKLDPEKNKAQSNIIGTNTSKLYIKANVYLLRNQAA